MDKKNTIHLVIADDHELYREGLKLILKKEPDIKIVGEAENGRQLIDLVKQHKPDVVLTDIVMPVIDGMAALKQIQKSHPDIGVIALSMFDEENYIVDMLEAGAMGYLLKNADKGEIMDAIRSVYEGTPYYCRLTSVRLAKLISHSKFNPFKHKGVASFTEKEVEVIKLICEEKTNKEIAQLMFASPRTIEGYRLNILDKMNVKSTAGIVIYAIKNGIYQIGKI